MALKVTNMKAERNNKKPMTMHKENTQKLLRRVSTQEAFYFARGIGDYTGQSAASLTEFTEILCTVDAKAIDFHMERGDFERWVRNIFGDEELARRINKAIGSPLNSRREELVTIMTARLKEISAAPKTQTTSHKTLA
jgi:hypothetical protein